MHCCSLSDSSSVEKTIPILTIKELKLLRGLAQGLTNQQLADATFLSVNTIKTHLQSVYRKLLVKNRSEAVPKAKVLNLLEL
jgi:ATP/maltotriose-dependent transcriptional regulator MalT